MRLNVTEIEARNTWVRYCSKHGSSDRVGGLTLILPCLVKRPVSKYNYHCTFIVVSFARLTLRKFLYYLIYRFVNFY